MAVAPTIFDELRSAFGEAQTSDGITIVGRIPAADSEANKAILARVAEAVVAGQEIRDFEIAELRDLIEAVQAHPKVTLAPEWERGDPPPKFESLKVVTSLKIFGCRINSARCGSGENAYPLAIRVHLAIGSICVAEAGFNGVTFAATMFFMVTFAAGADFEQATFASHVWFNASVFLAAVNFYNATFMADAHFDRTTYASQALFPGATFAGNVRFYKSTFAAVGSFDSATFAAGADFEQATFAANALYSDATFATTVNFDSTTFAGDVSFHRSIFAGRAWFYRATFKDLIFGGDLRTCNVRLATAALAANARDLALPIPAVRSKDFWRFRARLAGIWFDWFGWHRVRALGQLTILNRVSLIALLVVPVLAALYVPLRDALRVHKTADGVLNPDAPVWLRLAVATLGDDPHMGLTITLAFLAAVGVTLGLLIYQVFATDEIKKHDEEEHVRDVEARYPEGEPQRDDGLRRALERLEDQAKKRPNRHPSFVKHHGDLIWLPPRANIEWFRDDTLPTVDQLKAEAARALEHAGLPGEPLQIADPKAREGFVPGAERARICIEEGARAEYWLRAREYLGWAWVSMILYVIGLSILLFILLRQVWLVTRAAGWH